MLVLPIIIILSVYKLILLSQSYLLLCYSMLFIIYFLFLFFFLKYINFKIITILGSEELKKISVFFTFFFLRLFDNIKHYIKSIINKNKIINKYIYKDKIIINKVFGIFIYYPHIESIKSILLRFTGVLLNILILTFFYNYIFFFDELFYLDLMYYFLFSFSFILFLVLIIHIIIFFFFKKK